MAEEESAAKIRKTDRETAAVVRRLEAEAAQRALVMETANQVALDILASRTGVDALRHIAEAARTLAGARYAALGVARLDGTGLSEFITVGLTPEEEGRIGPRPRGVGVLGLLLTCTEPLRVETLSKHPAAVGFPTNHPPMKSFLGVPIRRGETAVGSLYLTEKENGEAFTAADETAVQALGAHAAVAIHNLQMLARQRALLAGVINAQEDERRAVAYELHDGLTQYVMAAHLHVNLAHRALEIDNRSKGMRELQQGLEYLGEAVVESRRLVNGLRALALDDLGLAGALELLLSDEKNRAGWTQADLIHNIAGRRFDQAAETTIYRVAQEALTNARKHARTEHIRLSLLLTDEMLTLEVRDWGVGFVAEEKMGEYSHLGLPGMAERTTLLGGRYELRSTPGSGTIIQAIFPVLEQHMVPVVVESIEEKAE
jgi:signal transduction histidine kinase